MEFTIPHADLDEFNAMPTAVKDKVRRRLACFAQAHGFMSGGMSQARALQASGSKAAGCSLGSLKRHFPTYRENGDWRILTDARHEKAPGTNRDFLGWARSLKGSNKRATGGSAAWKEGIRQLVAGDAIPGLGTWREIWRRENPGQPTPDTCPYSELPGCQPKRFSHRNFYRTAKTTKTQDAFTRSGTAAARLGLGNLIEFDTSGLRPLEWIAFDDVRTDFLVLDPETNKVVELWLLVAMDVATRVILSFGCRPRRERADGTKEGLTRRDMQHLICGIFRRYGVPQSHRCMLLVENAAAAITTGFEAAILEATGGQVTVQRTPMLSGNPFLEGWGESAKGNPHGKAWVESYFNLLHNEAGSIKGQIGADYSLRNQNVAPAIRHTEALAKKAAPVLSLLDRRMHRNPFTGLYEAKTSLEEIFLRGNIRRNHTLQGFDMVQEWQWQGMPPDLWYAWSEYPGHLPEESRSKIIPRSLPESPWMRLTKLLPGCKFAPLAASTLPALLLDHAVATYHGGGVIAWKNGNKVWRYDVADLRLEEGAKFTAWHDKNQMEDGVWLTNQKGAFIGHAQRTMRVPVGDIEAMTAAVKRKGKVFADALEEMRGDMLTEPVLNARLEAADADLETLHMARALMPGPAEPDADAGGTAATDAASAVTTATRAKAQADKAARAAPLSPRLFSAGRDTAAANS